MSGMRYALAVLLTLFSLGCGGGSSSSTANNSTPTQMSGNWNFTTPANSGTFSLSADSCTLSLVGAIPVSVSGPSCFQGVGVVSDGSSFNLLIGVPANPVADGSTMGVAFGGILKASGDIVIYSGAGTIAHGTASGNYICESGFPCTGQSNSFTAIKQ